MTDAITAPDGLEKRLRDRANRGSSQGWVYALADEQLDRDSADALAKARVALEEIETLFSQCQVCDRERSYDEGAKIEHAPNCPVGAALEALR
jgi:hypothetical protein